MDIGAVLDRMENASRVYGIDSRYLSAILRAQVTQKYNRSTFYRDDVLYIRRAQNSVTGVNRSPGLYDERALDDDVARAAQNVARILAHNGASPEEMLSPELLLRTKPDAIYRLFDEYFMDIKALDELDEPDVLATKGRALFLHALGTKGVGSGGVFSRDWRLHDWWCEGPYAAATSACRSR